MKPPRPDDFDDYWYQDDEGVWRNEYTDMGYEFAEDEEFYSEEELRKAEQGHSAFFLFTASLVYF